MAAAMKPRREQIDAVWAWNLSNGSGPLWPKPTRRTSWKLVRLGELVGN